ncbi:hypothetical protein MTS1_02202 [Microbacterium sp. TS-1]|nr:hypothetical protein MTS1_02202 [Microbacterium sp. TS-1]
MARCAPLLYESASVSVVRHAPMDAPDPLRRSGQMLAGVSVWRRTPGSDCVLIAVRLSAARRVLSAGRKRRATLRGRPRPPLLLFRRGDTVAPEGTNHTE